MPTSTVEDYLKCIYVEGRSTPGELVSTGRIASAMKVAPGTVTAMMKTLTESGLTRYEPYAGVSLTEAGHKLAAHVLRRHRLVELFLVEIMKMDWSEVHAEAEVLEHAVSESLIERIDAMLGHPSVDPHGDPIPTAGGEIEEPDLPSLMNCRVGQTLSIARVTDQRTEFLQLLEKHGLMPGRRARVDSRDELAETVLIRPENGSPLQLGFQAATRILVETIGASGVRS
jgi:DtxR family Mn-dependent transcriptional regulator